MQRRTLVRARDAAGFRLALSELALAGPPFAARRRAVVVPSRAAAELLRQTIERRAAAGGRAAVILPDLLTRDDWVARLHGALADPPRWLSRVEREVLFERAARSAERRARMPGAPFAIRPGLVAAMLDFYDELRRRGRSVRRFTQALFSELRVERGTDRGSESLVHATCFLALTFLAYQRAVAAADGLDEHGLRERLIGDDPPLPFDHVIAGVADHPSDPRGLWPADFALLGRLRGFAAVDVVVTDETHDAGFRERIERELPGIEEVRYPVARRAPVLVRPPRSGDAERLVHVSRDREEELRDVARAIRSRPAPSGVLAPTAVVFQRPLPYVYLAQRVLDEAALACEAFDAFPLAADPYAALVDLVITMARTGGTRETTGALLRSPHLLFVVGRGAIEPEDASSLDGALIARRSSGEADTYPREVDLAFGGRTRPDRADRDRAARAAAAASTMREELTAFRTGGHASDQVRALLSFLRRHHRPDVAEAGTDRARRARAAVLGVLEALADAYARHDDAPRPADQLTAAIHHAIEAHTLAPHRGRGGVHLVDAVAARFGDFEHVHLVGLVEGEWTERPRRSIFYTAELLKALGWPQQPDQLRAEQAVFRDLLSLASGTTRLHAFELEGDAVVGLSPLVEIARGVASIDADAAGPAAIFADERLTRDPPWSAHLAAGAANWLALRAERPAALSYRGFVGARDPVVYAVRRVDQYLACPFKYFAEAVLRLPDERAQSAGLTPLERGTLVHELFERFYAGWQADGLGTITVDRLPEALDRFAGLAHDALTRYPEADRALEETRLLGSLVARGFAERVFELEADAGGDIAGRLLELEVSGTFAFPELGGLRERRVDIRGKADRVDLFASGEIRVVDYKLGREPDRDRSVQVAVYAYCAERVLEQRDGRPHPVGSAMYIAFGDDRDSGKPLQRSGQPAGPVVVARAGVFAEAIGRIEAGEYPPRPHNTGDCRWCAYAGVCRKEYVADAEEADAAESV